MASKSKNRLAKQDKEKLDNRTVMLSSIIFIYAILLLFIKKMADSSMTVNGAIAFIEILRWVSLGGAMLCAAWSAYKEKRSFFIYCGICIYVFLSTGVILYCGQHNKAYLINFIALFISFVIIQLYYVLKVRGFFEKKFVRVCFVAACVIAFVAIAIASVLQRF